MNVDYSIIFAIILGKWQEYSKFHYIVANMCIVYMALVSIIPINIAKNSREDLKRLQQHIFLIVADTLRAKRWLQQRDLRRSRAQGT